MIKGVKSFDSKEIDEIALKKFSENLFYLPIDTSNSSDYAKLRERLISLDSLKKTNGNFIFYLATPPLLYETVTSNLGIYNLQNQVNGWKRIIIEKPFGYDMESAKVK
jgi:glucose-6-phosphate 1-dehydrogenase